MTGDFGAERYQIDESRTAISHLDGEAVVLDVRHGTYFSLNSSASELWPALARGATHDELVSALARPDAETVDREQVSRDVDDFLQTLRTEGLLVEQA